MTNALDGLHCDHARDGALRSRQMLDLSTIQVSSTIFRYESKVRAEESLALWVETACPGETFDLFDNGRGYVIRMFEDGEFVSTV